MEYQKDHSNENLTKNLQWKFHEISGKFLTGSRKIFGKLSMILIQIRAWKFSVKIFGTNILQNCKDLGVTILAIQYAFSRSNTDLDGPPIYKSIANFNLAFTVI